MPRSSRPPPPSFSFVARIGEPEDPWTLCLQDFSPLATRRELRLDMGRPTQNLTDELDPLMRTVERQLAGRLSYEAVYTDAKAVDESTDDAVEPPHRAPTPQPDPLGSHPFTRIIRSRGPVRPESLYKTALKKVLLAILKLSRDTWGTAQRVMAKVLCRGY